MTSQPRRRTVLILALIGTSALVALCLLLIRGTDKAAGSEEEEGRGLPAIAAHFSVLGEATQQQLEALSPAASALLARPGSPVEALGEGDYEGDDVLVAVANGSVCAIDESPAGGGAFCGGPEEALDGQLVSAGFCLPGLPEGQARLFGLVPDGVASVRIEGAGQSEEVPVIDNSYIAEVPAESTVISAVDSEDRHLEVELPLQEGAEASGTCAQR